MHTQYTHIDILFLGCCSVSSARVHIVSTRAQAFLSFSKPVGSDGQKTEVFSLFIFGSAMLLAPSSFALEWKNNANPFYGRTDPRHRAVEGLETKTGRFALNNMLFVCEPCWIGCEEVN